MNNEMNKEKDNSDDVVSLGKILKLLKIARGLSSKQLAEQVGVSTAYITAIESDEKSNLSMDLLSRYAEALDIKKSVIMAFDEDLCGKKIGYTQLLYEILKKIVDKQ